VLCACEGSDANGPCGVDAGEADRVDPPRSDGTDGGGRARRDGAAGNTRDAASSAIPWGYGDGGIPRSVALDSSCPSFEVVPPVTGYDPHFGFRTHGVPTTALGCCLPSGLCGGAMPVAQTVATPSLPTPTFAGWDHPVKCDRSADLPAVFTQPPKSCDYPFELDAASSDATTMR
jgi:hypothetical protein